MSNESEDSRAGTVNGVTGDAFRETRLGRFCRRVPHAYDALRLALAVVLLAAAGLKAKQLMTEPVIGSGLLESRRLLIGVVEFELLVALWLLSTLVPSSSGRRAKGEDFWTWFASIALFSRVWLHLALEGDCRRGKLQLLWSCACEPLAHDGYRLDLRHNVDTVSAPIATVKNIPSFIRVASSGQRCSDLGPCGRPGRLSHGNIPAYDPLRCRLGRQ